MSDAELQSIKALGGYFYLASPYSKHPKGMEYAFRAVSAAAAHLIKSGIPVFCPIAHSHPIAKYGSIPAESHDIWLPADEPLMRAATGIIVCKLEGWESSYGVNYEIDVFTEQGKPVFHMEWQ